VRQGVALADIGQQSRFDLAARLFMLVRGQCSGAQVGFELAQLIAVYRDMTAARVSPVRKPRRSNGGTTKSNAPAMSTAPRTTNESPRSASFPARSSAARLCSEPSSSKVLRRPAAQDAAEQ